MDEAPPASPGTLALIDAMEDRDRQPPPEQCATFARSINLSRVSFWGCGQRIEALIPVKQQALMSIS